MEPISRNTKTSVYFSISYVLAGVWQPDKGKMVEFQKALLDNGLDFEQTNSRANGFILIRTQPSHLHIKIEVPGPQVSTITIQTSNPQYDLEMFCHDSAAVMAAYQSTWPADHYQILTTTAKIHHLYSSQGHAFKYLWENRLGQSPTDFNALGGRPVAGGGLRLLMPPHAKDDEEPVSIEIRVESFLREPDKLMVETSLTWPKPQITQGQARINPTVNLSAVERFATNEVWNFITQENKPE